MNTNDVKLKELYIEVTNACPQHCIHCSARSGKPYIEELGLPELLRIVKEAKPLGLERLLVTGGEPLLNPDITLALLEECVDLPVIQLLTSGILIDDSWANNLTLNRHNLIVEMSVFAAKSNIHDRITQLPGSLARIINATKKCISKGIRVNWEFVITALNYEEVQDVIRIAEHMGVNQISILRLSPTGRAKDNLALLQVDFHQVTVTLFQAQRYAASSNFSVRAGGPINFSFVECGDEPKPCTAGVDKLHVQADGNTLPCPGFKDLAEYWGYNAKNFPLETVWLHSPAFNRLREFLLGEQVRICPHCSFSRKCRGRCASQRLHLHGELERGPDPLCPLAVQKALATVKSLAV